MRVTRVELRDFRNYERAEVALPAGLTVICGPNGAGKTNLLEAIYFGCTGALTAHVQRTRADPPRRERRPGRARPGGGRRRTPARGGIRAGRAQAPARGRCRPRGLAELEVRAAPVSVFMPERLELVKGASLAAGARISTSSWPRSGRRARRRERDIRERWRSGTRCWRGCARGRGALSAARGVGCRAGRAWDRAHGRPARGGGGAAAGLRGARRAPGSSRGGRAAGTGRAHRPPTADELRARARGAARGGPRARLHRARAAPRRPSAARSAGARTALLRVPGPAAHLPARAPVRRARAAGRAPQPAAR